MQATSGRYPGPDACSGYEKPQTGPTTNFVGNHMTQVRVPACSWHLAGRQLTRKPQAAIDLVQGTLYARSPCLRVPVPLCRLFYTRFRHTHTLGRKPRRSGDSHGTNLDALRLPIGAPSPLAGPEGQAAYLRHLRRAVRGGYKGDEAETTCDDDATRENNT